MFQPRREDMPVLRELACRVARAFYEPRQIIVLDALTHVPMMRDDDLAQMLHCSRKEARTVCARLRDERILRHVPIKEARGEFSRPVTRNFYLYDWPRFIDGVKWRLMRIRDLIGDELTRETAQKGYWCPTCQQSYTPEEALGRTHPVTGMFLCTYCPPQAQQELQERDSSQRVLELQDKLRRWTEETQPFMDLLRRSDQMELPAIDEDVLKLELVQEVRQQAAADLAASGMLGQPEETLRFAEESGLRTGARIRVDIQDEFALATEQAQAQTSRAVDNAVPVWMDRSTVTSSAFDGPVRAGTDHPRQSESAARAASGSAAASSAATHPGADRTRDSVANGFPRQPEIDLDQYYSTYTEQLHAELRDSAGVNDSKRASPQVEDADVIARSKKIRLDDGWLPASPAHAYTGSIDMESDGQDDDEDEFEEVG